MKKIVAVTVALLFLTAADCPGPENLDNGFMEVDGLELHPGALPFWVAGDDTVPAGLLEDACAWWNDELGSDVLFVAEPADIAQITVSVGYVPASIEDIDLGNEPLGVADVAFAADGEVLGAVVTLSSDIAYDEDTLALTARHELGHGFAGLADDPGPPVTVDLCSIMSSPLDPLGELTDGDRARLEPFLP